MNVFKEFFQVFKKPTALQISAEELADAERSLLSAHSAVEYAQALVGYNQARVERLRKYVNVSTK
jgi:hypothetical protein